MIAILSQVLIPLPQPPLLSACFPTVKASFCLESRSIHRTDCQSNPEEGVCVHTFVSVNVCMCRKMKGSQTTAVSHPSMLGQCSKSRQVNAVSDA